MNYQYIPTGVCAKCFDIEIKDGKIMNLTISGGCKGNTKGIEMLCKGRSASEVAKLLKGIPCGMRQTSCPDQLAAALEQALNNPK